MKTAWTIWILSIVGSRSNNNNRSTGPKPFFTAIGKLHGGLMVPDNFHEVDGDLSDHNVGKIFGLSKILTVTSCFTRIWIGITRILLLCFALGSLSASIHL